MSRIDIIGLNGNEGTHYHVEAIAKLIAGDRADEALMGKNKGKKRWELNVAKAMEIVEYMEKINE